MANFNMGFTRKLVSELGLDVQLIPATNPYTCKEIRTGNQVIKVANKTKIEIEAILTAIKGGCKDVKGELRQETNKSNIEQYIDLSLNLSQVIKEYIKLEYKNPMNSLQYYMNSFMDFHCLNDEGEYKENIQEVEANLLNMFSTRTVIVFKDVVISKQGLKEVIELWNKKHEASMNIESTLNSIIDRLEAIDY
jgi:hypothetical protein